ncbi:MAG TPA: hypothetical protein VGM75_11675 [Pseudonocardiaceae bacterium]
MEFVVRALPEPGTRRSAGHRDDHRQQRLDACPQLVGHHPRRLPSPLLTA